MFSCRKQLSQSGGLDLFYTGERLQLERETENMGVEAKKWKGVKALIIMATSCSLSLHLGKGEQWIARKSIMSWTRHSR